MKFLSVLLLLGGYVLFYASIARSGRFASEPWQALFQDAYDTVPESNDIPATGPSAGRIKVPSGGSIPFYPGIK